MVLPLINKHKLLLPASTSRCRTWCLVSPARAAIVLHSSHSDDDIGEDDSDCDDDKIAGKT